MILQHPKSGQKITVPADRAASYIAQGWTETQPKKQPYQKVETKQPAEPIQAASDIKEGN